MNPPDTLPHNKLDLHVHNGVLAAQGPLDAGIRPLCPREAIRMIRELRLQASHWHREYVFSQQEVVKLVAEKAYRVEQLHELVDLVTSAKGTLETLRSDVSELKRAARAPEADSEPEVGFVMPQGTSPVFSELVQLPPYPKVGKRCALEDAVRTFSKKSGLLWKTRPAGHIFIIKAVNCDKSEIHITSVVLEDPLDEDGTLEVHPARITHLER